MTSVDYVITTEYDINLCRLVMIKIEDERITSYDFYEEVERREALCLCLYQPEGGAVLQNS